MTFLSNSLGNLKEHTILYFSLDPQKTPWGQAHTSAPTKKMAIWIWMEGDFDMVKKCHFVWKEVA